ncbi:MAG: hypothetical protein F6K62_10800 [Sphaerospermopsis sp. SIO1G2]|nr:hypothetical protein [Sphaerospermopsis sp. SIO1G2]
MELFDGRTIEDKRLKTLKEYVLQIVGASQFPVYYTALYFDPLFDGYTVEETKQACEALESENKLVYERLSYSIPSAS